MNRWADQRRFAGQTIVPGALAGLVGGVAFGAAMVELGVLPTVASLVRTDVALVGFVVHMTIAAIVGVGLGIVLRGSWAASDVIFWGVAYGAFFWFVGPLTLQPLILGGLPSWDVAAAQAAYPSLLGHVIWGATAGIALVAIKPHIWLPDSWAVSPGILLRGLAAGLLAFAAVSLLPAGTERMLSPWGSSAPGGGSNLGPLGVAFLAATGYAVLHPASTPTAGAALVRGAGFGFLIWVVGGLTLLPILRGEGLNWSLADARSMFPALPGSILFGAAMALAFHWLGRIARLFFSDVIGPGSPDGGAWGVRAVVRGAAAGLVGGLIFSLVMLQVGFLPTVARLVGSDSELVGFVVHLVIAEVVGASYGVLFRRQTFDPSGAIGWGVSYGFVWWILGPLTLAPVILGATPAWTVEAAAAVFPGLIGHLAYGAGLGLSYHVLESRYSPWWITRTEAEARRMARRLAETRSAGPALWALLVLVAMVVPIILAPDR